VRAAEWLRLTRLPVLRADLPVCILYDGFHPFARGTTAPRRSLTQIADCGVGSGAGSRNRRSFASAISARTTPDGPEIIV
jgi:hypothetical protein